MKRVSRSRAEDGLISVSAVFSFRGACRAPARLARRRSRAFYGALPAPPRDPFTLFVWEVLSVSLDAAQARRGARSAQAAAARSRPTRCGARRRRSSRRACPRGTVCRAAAARAADRRRSVPPRAEAAGDHPRPAAGRTARARGAAADGRRGRLPDAALCGGSSGPSSRRAGEPRVAAPRIRRGAERLHEDRAIGTRGARRRAAADPGRVPPRVPVSCPTTAPPPARSRSRTARSVR